LTTHITQKVIGIDLGGTNTRAGLVDESGRISKRAQAKTPHAASAGDIVDVVIGLIKNVNDPGAPAKKVGIGAASVIDFQDLRKSMWPNLPGLQGHDFVGEIADKTGLIVTIENDANAAVIGERWQGAAKGTQNAVGITLGTGVGGGIIINGELVRGASGSAGEIGHICVDPNGPLCGCGSTGCLEQYSSATAVVRITKEILASFPESPLHSKLELDAKDVFDAALGGDLAGIKVFEEAGRYLGIACAALVNLLNPEVIVVMGGLAGAWNLMGQSSREELQKRAFQQAVERVNIVRGVLGDDAGILGAAKLTFADMRFSGS